MEALLAGPPPSAGYGIAQEQVLAVAANAVQLECNPPVREQSEVLDERQDLTGLRRSPGDERGEREEELVQEPVGKERPEKMRASFRQDSAVPAGTERGQGSRKVDPLA